MIFHLKRTWRCFVLWKQATALDTYVNAQVQEVRRDTVSGGWTVRTSRGFFTERTLREAIENAYIGR
jgi:hypothetical protein